MPVKRTSQAKRKPRRARKVAASPSPAQLRAREKMAKAVAKAKRDRRAGESWHAAVSRAFKSL